jgi:coenzyme F420 hydrogenase subunit beta
MTKEAVKSVKGMGSLPSSTVTEVGEAYLCCSCGACAIACPEKAVSYKETSGGYCFPFIDRNRCTKCGRCLNVCAGIRLAADLPEDPFAGISIGCWVGKASDGSVHEGSQSGGAVSALLLASMAEGTIGGALTVTMEPGITPRPKARIARNRDEVLSARGSKYCPVPVLSALEKLEPEDKSIALVGLGCHVHGLKNILDSNPDACDKVGPVIGLICDRVMTAGAVDYLIFRSGINKGKKSTFEYRSKKRHGYPGEVRIVSEGEKEVFLQDKERRRIKDYFTPVRCRICFDKMNVLSDITVGDPWGVAEYDRDRGESVVIARTNAGHQAVESAIDKGFLEAREIPYDTVLHGQGINGKRKEFFSYCSEWTAMNRPLPEQSERTLGGLEPQPGGRKFAAHLYHSLELDRFDSRESMFTDIRKWLRKRRMAKKISKIFRPLTLLMSFSSRKK